MAVETTAPAPAARVLDEAGRRNAELGHENNGPLSVEFGFVSSEPPPHHLPEPHDAWVQAADELPSLCRSLSIRKRLDDVPLLDASVDSLDDRVLLRAASVIGLLNQAYNNVPILKPEHLPEALRTPWLQIAKRLDRPALTLSTNDYIWYNFRLLDADSADPMRVENLDVLTKIWDHPQMSRFMLVTLEMMAQSGPCVGGVVRAQEAVHRHDDQALKAELAAMTAVIKGLAYDSLPKINTNARSGPKRVDPVVWAKLFAMLPLPVEGAEGVRNASGVETPFFHLMDVFLGRKKYDTQLGHESQMFRKAYPTHWKQFLAAVAEEPVVEHVAASKDAELKGLFLELAASYHGKHGLLGRHRLKAFGFMDAAFKVGRSSTVTGFSGLFEDRAWEKVDSSFEDSRLEREASQPPTDRIARVQAVEDLCSGVRRIVLDVRGLGMQGQPGDRLAVLPENAPELVERTLRSLHATGEEMVDLNRAWQAALPSRPGYKLSPQARLRDILAFGHIRPVARVTAKALYALTHDESLHKIIEARTEDQWELWDLLELLATGGFHPERLWRAERGDHESIVNVMAPVAPRLYSISALGGDGVALDTIELTVGHMFYDSIASETSVARRREGTASTYLTHTLYQRPGGEIPVKIVRPGAFALPVDPTVPVVMFSGGTGFAPFRGFLQERLRTPDTQNVLFAAARTPELMPYREELEDIERTGQAKVIFAYDGIPTGGQNIAEAIHAEENAAMLRELVKTREEGGSGASLYVCGRATFSRVVLDALAEVVDEPSRPGRETIYDLVAQSRYMQDVFSTYAGSTAEPHPRIDASELVRHCSPQDGLWMAIFGRIYDLSEFAETHPGGRKVIQSFSGMDATSSYRIVEHHLDPEVEAMLSMYPIGVMRRIEFGSRWAVAIGDEGLEYLPIQTLYRRWAQVLYMVVEMENAHRQERGVTEEPLNSAEQETGERPRTAYRLLFTIEAHGRVVRQTIPIISRHVGHLWQSTSGPCSAQENHQALDNELAALLQSPEATAAMAHIEALEHELTHVGPSEDLYARAVALLEADAKWLEAAKLLLARGVHQFEVHEADVVEEGGHELLEALRGVVGITRDHLTAAGQGASLSAPGAAG